MSRRKVRVMVEGETAEIRQSIAAILAAQKQAIDALLAEIEARDGPALAALVDELSREICGAEERRQP